MIASAIGAVIASRAGHSPANTEKLELLAGALIIGGLGLIGFALQDILHLAGH
jgi:hypothetical protein